jgi:hypothetical protein
VPHFTVKEEESAKGKVTECVPALGLEGFYDLPEHERRYDLPEHERRNDLGTVSERGSVK